MGAMGFTMSLNFLLLVAMVATNLLSLYHLSSHSFFSTHRRPTSPPSITPSSLLQQLHTIRATINSLTLQHHHPSSSSPVTPSDLVTYSKLSTIASACHDYPDLLYQYMNYTPFTVCPRDETHLAESLILRGCHPLPRRRCFSTSPLNPKPLNAEPQLGMDLATHNFFIYRSELDLTIPQLMDIAKRKNSMIRLGVDIGGGAGNFAVAMRLRNVTVVTTTMNFGVPYSEANAVRGVVPLHAPLQQRLPVFDGVVDLVRCGRAVNRWIPVPVLEFLLLDVDRVLRGGGFLWVDHFFSKEVDLENVYKPLFMRLGYNIVKWATGRKTDSGGVKNGEVYLTALMQKPKSR